jgi:hypothetical protein
MRRETKNEILITVVVSLFIVAAAVYGLSSQNVATYNGPTLQTYNYNVSEVTSMNQTLSTVTNNGVSALDILNTSGTDNQFSSTSTGYYPGTLRKNITLKINSTM